MVNSNFYGLVCIKLLMNKKNFLFSVFDKDAIYVRPTTIQTARAANIVCAAFQFRDKIDHEYLKPVIYPHRLFLN